MANNQIMIEISYSLKDDPKKYLQIISPDEYFDSRYLDPGEIFEVESVSRYWNGIDYLDKNIRDFVTETRINIYDSSNEFRVIVTDTYWNKQMYLVRERVDFLHDVETYRIIIVSLRRTDSAINEILRIEKIDDSFRPIGHTIFQEDSVGQEMSLESYSRGMDDHGKLLRKFLS